MVMSIVLWAQVAVFTHIYIYIYIYLLMLMIGTGGSWVELPVQGRLYPIFMNYVGLPDIHEYSMG